LLCRGVFFLEEFLETTLIAKVAAITIEPSYSL